MFRGPLLNVSRPLVENHWTIQLLICFFLFYVLFILRQGDVAYVLVQNCVTLFLAVFMGRQV